MSRKTYRPLTYALKLRFGLVVLKVEQSLLLNLKYLDEKECCYKPSADTPS